MNLRYKINSFLSLIAGAFLTIFARSPDKPTVENYKRVDFKTSTQHLGVRFTEKIRDVFRFRWIVGKRKT